MPAKVKITDDAADVLRRSTVNGGAGAFVLTLPAQQLARPLYEEVNKVLAALGGKWNRKAGGHTFANDPGPALTEALGGTGEVEDKKVALQQFFTPPDVAELMGKLVGAALPGGHVLEPSIGTGQLVATAIACNAKRVTGLDIDPEMVRHTLVAAEVNGWAAKANYGFRVANFMEWEPAPSLPPIDVVLMNPPFTKNQDIQHVERALRFLRPGGVLCAVMSPGWRFKTMRAAADFRALLAPMMKSWTELPESSFRSSGTNVNTGILLVHK